MISHCTLRSAFLLLVTITTAVNCTVKLEALSTLYLPYTYNNGNPSYGIDTGAIEQLTFDPRDKMIYTVGDQVIHVIDISDVNDPKIVHHVNMTNKANDIELCGDYIAVAVSAVPTTAPGSVFIFDLYNPGLGSLEIVQTITVGSEPDMLAFSKNCQTIVVCNEGEPGEDGKGAYVDPEGSVTVLKFASTDLSETPTIETADFTAFNNMTEEYLAKGVRAPLMGQLPSLPSTFSQNMEPEIAALNMDDTIAYVALQENNAIAVVDIATATVTEIFPLGFKDHTEHPLDASDSDSGINIQPWPVYGMYQPDSIAYYYRDGEGYLLTANEGSAMSLSISGEEWDESMRGQSFVSGGLLSDDVPQELAEALNDTERLGRLFFSTVDGKSAADPSKIDTFYAYGARSFSVVRTSDMQMIYESSDDMEKIHAETYPSIFNMNAGDSNFSRTPEDTMDERSDDKGPEPEAITFGRVGDKDIIFVGLEKTASLMLYRVTAAGDYVFESIYRPGGLGKSVQRLYDEKNLGDYDPEDLKYIDADDSPNRRPLLAVAGTISGTLSLYNVVDVETTSKQPTQTFSSLLLIVSTMAVTLLSR
ncbi:mesenchyme-specific cell surface glycoprotein-like [Ptychodera flava]|uniref:mesenchyme-specific cell surface glycoprotein-like n=1 Tax=Ptychodera flava TaxID=63121 RepID=UPI00396A8221